MILYKYRSLSNFEHVADIILNDRLYCPTYEELNDPFEGLFVALWTVSFRDKSLNRTYGFPKKLEETLKWGEPSYLTPESKSGSTIRIDRKKSNENQYAIYFKCTANLVPAFREKFPNEFKFEGNRSIIFDIDDEIPIDELKRCIAIALTYHRNKKLSPDERWKIVTTNA